MDACFGSFSCLQIAFSCIESSNVEGLLLWQEKGRGLSWGNQKSGFQLWLCPIDLFFLSLTHL